MFRPEWHCRYLTLAECGLHTHDKVESLEGARVRSEADGPAVRGPGLPVGQTRPPDALPILKSGLIPPTAIEALAEAWLAEGERVELSRLRSPHRRRSWLAGRIAAKRMLINHRIVPRVEAPEITIVSRNQQGTGIAPSIRIGRTTLRQSLSISHTDRGVLIGVSTKKAVRVGTDLVLPRELGAGFRQLWFTERERALMRLHDDQLSPAVLWAAKEAAFKAWGQDRPFAPQQIEIQPHGSGHMTCLANGRNSGGACHIFCWRVDGHIATFAAYGHWSAIGTRRTYEICG